MKTLFKIVIALLAVTGAVMLATALFGMQFGRENYWDHHGFFFLFFIALFPRLTLLLSSVATGGLIWWLAWIFAPRILVATLATIAYWHQNPILVAIAWVVALGGESSEKYVAVKRRAPQWAGGRGYDEAKWVDAEIKK
jgi:hypothetical protein